MSPFENENENEMWGQFIDIENGYLIREQSVTSFTIPKPKPKPKLIEKPILKSILKPLSITPFIIIPNPIKTKEIDSCNNEALNKMIERQIYFGCFICILTASLFIMP